MGMERDSRWHWSHIEKSYQDIFSYNLDSIIYRVLDLLLHKLQGHVPSVRLHVYTEKEIEHFGSSLPLV